MVNILHFQELMVQELAVQELTVQAMTFQELTVQDRTVQEPSRSGSVEHTWSFQECPSTYSTVTTPVQPSVRVFNTEVGT